MHELRVHFAFAHRLIAVIFVMCGCSHSWGQWTPNPPPHFDSPTKSESESKYADVVTPELIASVQEVQAGQTFELAVVLDIRRDWTIFWKSPTDGRTVELTAKPTTIAFTPVDGFAFGTTHYTGPTTLAATGGGRIHVYQDEAVLLTTITPSDSLSLGAEVTFHLEATWSIQRIGEPEIFEFRRDLEYTIRIASEASSEVEPMHAERFSEIHAAIPQPFTDAADIELVWSQSILEPCIEFRLTDVDHVEFIPASHPHSKSAYASQDLVIMGEGEDELRLKVAYHNVMGAPVTAGFYCAGLLVRQRGDVREYFNIENLRPSGFRPRRSR